MVLHLILLMILLDGIMLLVVEELVVEVHLELVVMVAKVVVAVDAVILLDQQVRAELMPSVILLVVMV